MINKILSKINTLEKPDFEHKNRTSPTLHVASLSIELNPNFKP